MILLFGIKRYKVYKDYWIFTNFRMTSYVTTNLNISTLVYMLETNIQIDPDKLEDIFSNIEPIDYNNPILALLIRQLKIYSTINFKYVCIPNPW